MKRIILTIAAVAAVAGPMVAAATDASAQPRAHRGNDRHDDRRWDGNRHNGYYIGSRFHYGPPPASYYGRPDFRPGYARWQRGGYLPQSYWGSRYVVYDYGRYGLRRPPSGYRWYNVNGDYVLAALAGGLIAEALSH